MPNQPEIVLERGTTFVRVRDIPAKIARALHPAVLNAPREVVAFTKEAKPGATGAAAEYSGWTLSEDDLVALDEIWKDLPPLSLPVPEPDIAPYAETFARHADRFDWKLGYCARTPSLHADIRACGAEEQHRKHLALAIRDGKLTPRTALGHIPTDEHDASAIVLLEDFRQYASDFGIVVRFEHYGIDRDRILQRIERRKKEAGRYTLEEAARTIADSTGERADELTCKLIAAAERGELATYEPGKNSRYVYDKHTRARAYGEETHWDELNGWLDKHDRRIGFRFPEPQQVTASPSPKAVPRSTAQDGAILEAIRQKGLDPKRLPKTARGKPGIKAEIRAYLLASRKDLFISRGVFDDAWQRLRNSNELSEDNS